MFLLDVNLWLALAFESHVHHATARNWFDALGDDRCSFCRMTQQGFLRLATNPKAFGDEAATLAEAWHIYDAFISDPRVVFTDEPPNVENQWRAYTNAESFSPKVWNDAFLAAFARTAKYDLITFDRGFVQFKDLHATILS
jgi:hypothetical protein